MIKKFIISAVIIAICALVFGPVGAIISAAFCGGFFRKKKQ